MKVFVNQNIKELFFQIIFCILLCSAGSAAAAVCMQDKAAVYTSLCLLVMGIAVLLLCYRFFRKQNMILETATGKIRDYISGDRDARIDCNEEGQLYRLFHEVNSLAAILNAKAEKEGASSRFLQNTLLDISHQLKTPLAALNIYNGIIQTEAEAADLQTVKEFSDLSEQELDRIETLVQNLLKITKFDAGMIQMEKQQESILDLISDIQKQFSFRVNTEEKELLISGSKEVTFYCDRNWLTEAIGNLVKNALDHTKPGDTIQIAWEQSASAVRIVIQDTGSGIHPEDLYHIFKRFYRSRYSKDTQGIGLGLPLAKSVIEAHNGTIEVDSRLGMGTSFVMYFLIPTKL